MTNEPPQGFKNNLLTSFSGDLIADETFFEHHIRENEFKTLLYGLCVFHAAIQERKAYGSLGWNVQYDFNQSDLRINIKQLYSLLVEQEKPYYAIKYMVSECNYGGRITDDKDRRVIKALMNDFFGE